MTLTRLHLLLSVTLWALVLPLIAINLRYGFRFALILVGIVALATLPQLAYRMKPDFQPFRLHALAVTAIGLGMLAIKLLAVGMAGEPRSEILSYVVIGLVIAIGLVSRRLLAP
jgi:hypothetical protein